MRKGRNNIWVKEEMKKHGIAKFLPDQKVSVWILGWI